MTLVGLCHLGSLELVLVMSLVGLLCWACSVASWFFVSRLVASFVTSSVFFFVSLFNS
ncbi:hypothetical protein C2G38_2123415 [Gigaspora rosea]|uniref:Uncharacterized protein n=1 Tax=Gigaspora rosea TaxID=44941 RepID=A0A397U2B5_9GLOM|nr:hypothetical protein C2G38_2123415 [Gigaspora rosea]